jgi:steroid delta-isomerase-like uncharacterized protein
LKTLPIASGELLDPPVRANGARRPVAAGFDHGTTAPKVSDASGGNGLLFRPKSSRKGRNAMGKVADMARKYADAMNGHDPKAFSALYADNAVAYDPFYPEPLRGRPAIEQDATSFFKGFSDLRVEVHNVLDKDDRTGAAELGFKGTHDGTLSSPQGDVPATNKKIDMRGVGVMKLNDQGQIVEERRYYDTGQMMQQLGLTGAPPSNAPDAN